MTRHSDHRTLYLFDAELAPHVAALPGIDLTDIREARRQARALFDGLPPQPRLGVDVKDLRIGGGEHEPVDIRVYDPPGRGAGLRPGLVLLHGGGFVMGDLEFEHRTCLQIAADVGAVVVNVGYRLAPEHPFPAGLEDAYTALVWLAGEAAGLRVEPSRIAVDGLSAGGGLAAALALLTRDRGGPALCFQCLLSPELDDRLETPSAREFVDTPLWSRAHAQLSWQAYLGSVAGGDAPSPLAAPARSTDLSGLPPAFIALAQFDPLRDEGLDYARRLAEAGVPVELHLYPGTFHGSFLISDAAISRRQLADRLAALRRGLAPPGREAAA